MTQPIWDLDHLPKPAPRSDNSDICHPGAAKLSPFPSRLLPRFGQVCPFPTGNRGPSPKHRSIRRRPHPCCWDPRSHLLPYSSTGSDNPCSPPPRRVGRGRGPPGASSRGLRVWLGNGPGLESGDDVGLQTQTAAQKSREAIPGSSSNSRRAGKPGRARRGGLEPTMSGWSRAPPCRQVFPWHQT